MHQPLIHSPQSNSKEYKYWFAILLLSCFIGFQQYQLNNEVAEVAVAVVEPTQHGTELTSYAEVALGVEEDIITLGGNFGVCCRRGQEAQCESKITARYGAEVKYKFNLVSDWCRPSVAFRKMDVIDRRLSGIKKGARVGYVFLKSIPVAAEIINWIESAEEAIQQTVGFDPMLPFTDFYNCLQKNNLRRKMATTPLRDVLGVLDNPGVEKLDNTKLLSFYKLSGLFSNNADFSMSCRLVYSARFCLLPSTFGQITPDTLQSLIDTIPGLSEALETMQGVKDNVLEEISEIGDSITEQAEDAASLSAQQQDQIIKAITDKIEGAMQFLASLLSKVQNLIDWIFQEINGVIAAQQQQGGDTYFSWLMHTFMATPAEMAKGKSEEMQHELDMKLHGFKDMLKHDQEHATSFIKSLALDPQRWVQSTIVTAKQALNSWINEFEVDPEVAVGDLANFVVDKLADTAFGDMYKACDATRTAYCPNGPMFAKNIIKGACPPPPEYEQAEIKMCGYYLSDRNTENNSCDDFCKRYGMQCNSAFHGVSGKQCPTVEKRTLESGVEIVDDWGMPDGADGKQKGCGQQFSGKDKVYCTCFSGIEMLQYDWLSKLLHSERLEQMKASNKYQGVLGTDDLLAYLTGFDSRTITDMQCEHYPDVCPDNGAGFEGGMMAGLVPLGKEPF